MIIQSCQTTAINDPFLSISSLSCSFPLHILITHPSLPLSLPPCPSHPPLPPFLPPTLEYFTHYQNEKFTVHYTHAGVPGSSDTSGDSGGRRPRRRSEIWCNFTIRRKDLTVSHIIILETQWFVNNWPAMSLCASQMTWVWELEQRAVIFLPRPLSRWL